MHFSLRHTRWLQWRQLPLSLSLSLSLLSHTHTLYLCTRAIQLTLQNVTITTYIISVCPKSYLYIYDFRVIYTCVPSNRSIIRFSLTSIRRDLFPNKLPLHSGMGCRSSPICFRHAPSLSGVNTLVSIFDPFSVV